MGQSSLLSFQNGKLRYSFATLAGRNILWHIVAPPPAATPPLYILKYNLKVFERSLLLNVNESVELISLVGDRSLEKGGVFKEIPVMKNCGTTMERGRN